MSDAILKKKIAELEKKLKSLEKDLIHDQLTGLKTRNFFEEEARLYFGVASTSSGLHGTRRRQWFGFTQLSFIIFSIDCLVHDEVVQSIAESIKNCVRDGDTAARFSSDEISVTLVGATERDAYLKAEDIRSQVEHTRFGKFPKLRVTLSGGVASAMSGATLEDTLAKVSKALKEAKRKGNRIVSYSEL